MHLKYTVICYVCGNKCKCKADSCRINLILSLRGFAFRYASIVNFFYSGYYRNAIHAFFFIEEKRIRMFFWALQTPRR